MTIFKREKVLFIIKKVFQWLQFTETLSVQDDMPDGIDVSGIVPVVFAAEANAAADTLVNNRNQSLFSHS